MKIFLEFERLRNLESGLGQFSKSLLHAILQADKQNEYTVFLPKNFSEKNLNATIIRKKWWHKYWKPKDVYDIWHCTHQDSHYISNSQKSKLILTIHDLNFLEKYKHDNHKITRKLKQLQSRVDKASGLVFISNFTKNIFSQNIHISNKIPTAVIPNGNTLTYFESVNTPVFILNNQSFFFNIGGITNQKNQKVLLPLLQHFKTHTLILAGNKNTKYADELIKDAEKLGVSDRLILPGIISDADKFWLYKNCEAFIFPSLTEGFGLPVIEAMSLDKPVFISNRGALPEVGGAFAFQFENFESNTIINCIEKNLKIFEDNKNLQLEQKEYCTKFDWKIIANQYVQFYEEINKLQS